MSNFERRFGKYAIKNLSLILIACYGVGYVLQILDMNGITPNVLSYLYLEPVKIIYDFQIWRLITWLIVPPDQFSILTLLVLYFYYSIGTTLEGTWGTYKYNVYLFSGWAFTILGAFACFGVFSAILGTPVSIGPAFTTYYVNMSIFLAFAVTYPDVRVLFFFILPIRVKILGIIYGAFIVYEFIVYLASGTVGMCVVILASLLNFIIFYITQRKKMHFNPLFGKGKSSASGPYMRPTGANGRVQSAKDAATEENKTHPAFTKGGITRHKCAICGKTDESDPDMSFRFCSKCNGNYEYCQDHLFTHQHVE